MKSNLSVPRVSLATLSLLMWGTLAHAQSGSDDIQALREQIRLLDQKLRVLERKQEIKDEEAASAAKAAPKVTVSDKGFTLASADAANSIKLRGLVQLDNRLYFNDGGSVNNTFVLRRARIIAEGTFAKNYSFQLVPEFGGSGATSILDANLGIAISPQLQFKLGKFKSPVGLEQLQSDSWTFFNERSIVTNLVPNRDLGVQAAGDLLGGTLNYAVGVFGGVADGASSTNVDFDNDKDFAGRLLATPFKGDNESFFKGLTVGISGSVGREKTTAGRTAGYRTDGQQTFFSYLPTTVADGQNWRLSPQLDFRRSSLGLLGEYVASIVNVRPSATGAKAELQNKGWQLSGAYVLTGEDSSYAGVVPRSNFNFSEGTWGAFEIVGRYAKLTVDDAAFPLFASPASNANETSSLGLGLNWYLAKSVLFKIDYYQSKFGFSNLAPAIPSTPFLRQDEKAFVTRFQLTF